MNEALQDIIIGLVFLSIPLLFILISINRKPKISISEYKECHGCGTIFDDKTNPYKENICNRCQSVLEPDIKTIEYITVDSLFEKRKAIETSLYKKYVINNPENEAKYDMKLEFDRKIIEDDEIFFAELEKKCSSKPQYTPKCPTCQSPDIEKLSTGQKVMSASLFGLYSGRVRKTYHCNNCKYEW